MLKFYVPLIVLLVGCSASGTQVPFLDRVMTVAEFTAQPALRKKVDAFCANDPGRTMQDSNCINSQQATRIASVGNGNFPKISTALPW